MSGEIPASLTSLANMERLYIPRNQLTGCVPDGPRDVADNDLDELGLPYCDVLLSGLTVSPGSLVPTFDPVSDRLQRVSGPIAGHRYGRYPPTTTMPRSSSSTKTTLKSRMPIPCWRAFRSNSAPAYPPSRSGSSLQDSQEIRTYTITDLGNRYDVNDDGIIQRDEVISAIKDYFGDVITREETIEVIKLYFSS